MRGQDDRRARALESLQCIPEQVSRLWVKTRGRLIQHQDAWRIDQRTRNRESSLHAAGERLHLILCAIGQLEEFKQLIGAFGNLLVRQTEEATEDEKVLAHGQLLVKGLLLMHHTDLAADARAISVWVAPQDAECPRGARRDARDHAHRRRLPRPIRAEEAEELAVTDVEINGVHRRPLPEGLCQTSGADQRGGVRS